MTFIDKVRRIQLFISIIIFIVCFTFCWYTTNFKLLDIQLSYWGIDKASAIYWNATVVIISCSLFYNIYDYIISHPRLIFKTFISWAFFSAFLSLLLTGVINMRYYVHNVTAFYYFFTVPIVIYLMAWLNRKKIRYREWLGHMLYSSAMIVIPLIFINLFKGMAISEITHGCILVSWCIWSNKKITNNIVKNK